MRRRMPLLAFLLLAVVCLALLGFACACLNEQPMQAIDRALSAIPSLPAVILVWALAITFLGAAALLAPGCARRSMAPSAAALQRFLF